EPVVTAADAARRACLAWLAAAAADTREVPSFPAFQSSERRALRFRVSRLPALSQPRAARQAFAVKASAGAPVAGSGRVLRCGGAASAERSGLALPAVRRPVVPRRARA